MKTTDKGLSIAVKPKRTKLIITLVLAAVLGLIALDTKVVKIGSEEDTRVQAFSADRYAKQHFPRIRDMVIKRAPDAVTLANELLADKKAAIEAYGTPGDIGAVMPVKLTGIVGEGRSGVFYVTVNGIPEKFRIRVQTGPAINGTDLRDMPGDIDFSDFKNQIEYQDAGAGLNRAMAAETLQDIDREALTGKTIEVVGVFKLINPKNWLITPVKFEVK